MEKRIKIKYFVIATFLCILSFLFGLYFNNKKQSGQLIIDFKQNENKNDAFGPDFISAVGLHYLYQKENKNISSFNNYFDTLSYFRNRLVYLNIKDTNYLILYKPSSTMAFTEPLYGFTKSDFIIYLPQKTQLKNFPLDNLRRGD